MKSYFVNEIFVRIIKRVKKIFATQKKYMSDIFIYQMLKSYNYNSNCYFLEV